NHLEIGIALTHLAEQRRPIHLGHDHVGNDEIDVPCAVLQHLHGLDAVAGLENGVTARGEPAGIERAQALLILHQQDRTAAREIRRRLRRLARKYELARFGGSRFLGTRDMTRQENAEDGAASDFRFREDEAAGLLDDAVDGGKAEPRALTDLLGREEWLEDLVDMFRRDALAGVADLDQ